MSCVARRFDLLLKSKTPDLDSPGFEANAAPDLTPAGVTPSKACPGAWGVPPLARPVQLCVQS